MNKRYGNVNKLRNYFDKLEKAQLMISKYSQMFSEARDKTSNLEDKEHLSELIKWCRDGKYTIESEKKRVNNKILGEVFTFK